MRTLIREPLFSLVAVVSLALGIGVNTAIFSAVDAMLLRPMPLRDLDRGVIVYDASERDADVGSTFATFEAVRGRSETFDGVMAVAGARPVMLSDGGHREQVFAELVTADFFSLVDVSLSSGRSWGEEVDRLSQAPSEVVLSHTFWQRRFGADPRVVGRTLVLNGQPFVAVGITRAGFTGVDGEVAADLWMPVARWADLVGEPHRLTSGEHWLTTVALLRPDVSLEQAQGVVAAIPGPGGDDRDLRTLARPARQRHIGADMTEMLAVAAGALAAGLLVLTLACANVTSLLLARAASRQREVAVRLALGSSRGQIIRLWLTECLVLCFAAAGLGLLAASWMLGVVARFRPPVEIGDAGGGTLPLAFALDLRVFLFTLLLATIVALVMGLIAGVQGSRASATGMMGSDRVTSRRFAPGLNVRSSVIALQVALSLLLLIPCGLFVRSALNASSMSTGFAEDNVLLLPISSNQMGVVVNKPAGFEQQLIDRMTRVPGVESATVMDPVPLWFGGKFARFAGLRMGYSCVGPGYFDTLRIPLKLGRDFNSTDTSATTAVAIVNETLARRLWPDGRALGQRIDAHDEVLEVIGVAADSKYLSLAETEEPWLYRPIAQDPSDNRALSLAVRSTGDPLQWRDAVEREMKTLMPGWPSFQFRTLDEGVRLQRQLPKFAALVLGLIGAIGALLAAVGMYGVMAFSAHQRTREIGIRLALGASPRSVAGLLIRQGMAVCAAGGALGLLIALGGSQFLRSVLFGVSAADPLAYATMSALLGAVSLLACYLPARRAARANPIESLRRD